MKQEQKDRPRVDQKREQQQVAETPTSSRSERNNALKSELDALLDEVDEVLEENASEFVSSFIQKGGQ